MLIEKMKALRPKTLANYLLRPLSALRAAYKQLDQADQPTMPVALEMSNGMFVRIWAVLHEKLRLIAPMFEHSKTDFQEYDYPILVDWANEFEAKIKIEFCVFKHTVGLEFDVTNVVCAFDEIDENGRNFMVQLDASLFNLFCNFYECEHYLPLSKDTAQARHLIQFCIALLDR